MRGAPHYRGSKGSGLPKIHAPGPDGGALCGARRRQGVLTTDGHGCRPEGTDCAACKSKMSKPVAAPTSGPSRPKKYHVGPVGDGPQIVVETSSPMVAVKAWVAKHGRCDMLVTQVREYPRVQPMYWGVDAELGVYRVGGNWASLEPKTESKP